MDTAIAISAISTIIACGSFWVAYRAYLYSAASRNADKFLDLRIQAVEIMSLAQKIKYNSQSLSKNKPTEHDQGASEKLDYFIDPTEGLYKKLQIGPSSFSEQDINDIKIDLLDLKSKLELENEKIKEIINT